MKLTGKCAEDYSKWFYEQDYVNKIYDSKIDIIKQPFQNALIIEFFSTLRYEGKDFWLYVFDVYYKHRIEGMTINDINNQAIEKANEIFNNR